VAIEFYTGMAEVPSFTPLNICTVSLWYVELGWNVGGFNRVFGTADAWEIKIFGDAPHTVVNELCLQTGTESTGVVLAGTWLHIACTVDQSTGAWRTYLDGVLDCSGTGHTTAASGSTLGIGGRYGGVGVANGILEDVRIYNRVLSAGEIMTLYALDGCDAIRSGLVNRWIMHTKGGAGSTGVGGDNIYDEVGKKTANVMGGDAFYWGGRKHFIKRAI